MAERLSKNYESTEGGVEKGARWYRNFNAFVGGVALAGAAIAPPLAVPLTAYAGFNFLQAGGAEALRRHAKKRRKKGKSASNQR